MRERPVVITLWTSELSRPSGPLQLVAEAFAIDPMSDTRSFDFDIDYAFVASDDPGTVDGSKMTFAEYPDEKPSKLAIKMWT